MWKQSIESSPDWEKTVSLSNEKLWLCHLRPLWIRQVASCLFDSIFIVINCEDKNSLQLQALSAFTNLRSMPHISKVGNKRVLTRVRARPEPCNSSEDLSSGWCQPINQHFGFSNLNGCKPIQTDLTQCTFISCLRGYKERLYSASSGNLNGPMSSNPSFTTKV